MIQDIDEKKFTDNTDYDAEIVYWCLQIAGAFILFSFLKS